MRTLILPLIATTILVAFVLGTTVFSPTPVTTVTTTTNEQGAFLTYHAVVCKTVTRADGTVDDLGCSHNMFNLDGMRFVQNQISKVNASEGLATGIVSVIALANGTKAAPGQVCAIIASTDDNLCGEYTTCGMARAAGTVKQNNSATPNAGNWTITNTFTNSCSASIDINETGLFNTTTANQTGEIFFAQNNFTTATLANNDQINVTWFIWVV